LFQNKISLVESVLALCMSLLLESLTQATQHHMYIFYSIAAQHYILHQITRIL